MTHELINLPKASHETLSIILIYGGLASLTLLLWIGYMYWRDLLIPETN